MTSALFPIKAAHNDAACNKQAYCKKEILVVIVTFKVDRLEQKMSTDHEGSYRRAARDQQAVNRLAAHIKVSQPGQVTDHMRSTTFVRLQKRQSRDNVCPSQTALQDVSRYPYFLTNGNDHVSLRVTRMAATVINSHSFLKRT